MKNSISPSMRRATILVKGYVQRVGYRDAVSDLARQANIVGTVKNVGSFDVEIVTEGKEQDLHAFIDSIRIRNFPIMVEDTELTFSEATGEFKEFQIIRGNWQVELGERLDTAVKFLAGNMRLTERTVQLGEQSVEIGNKMLGKQDQMLEKQDQMLEKQDRTIEVLRSDISKKQDQMLDKQDRTVESIEHFRTDTGERFDRMDGKYGEINRNIRTAIERTESMMGDGARERELLRSTIERLFGELCTARKSGSA